MAEPLDPGSRALGGPPAPRLPLNPLLRHAVVALLGVLLACASFYLLRRAGF